MNIVYSTDDNYARHAGISMISLLDNNREVTPINIYVIDNDISDKNRENLDSIAKEYGRAIHYVNFEKYKTRLSLNNPGWELPISTYARLFIDEMLPESVHKVIYLDCDTIISSSISELWNTDIHGKTIAAVQDICYSTFRAETGIEQAYRYFCAGVLLIDLDQWRNNHCGQKIISYVDARNGVLRHHDQTILNGLFGLDYFILHPKYNALTPLFLMPYDNLKAYYNCGDDYYSKKEILEAVQEPAIIHFTSSEIGRPWENNAHPRSKLYRRYWRRSPWKDVPYNKYTSTCDRIQRRTLWLYRIVPVWLIKKLTK